MLVASLLAEGAVANSSTAGIITAVATLFIALSGLVVALPALIKILRATNMNTVQIKEVHTIVNQQHTDLKRYQVALVKALQAAGVEVPDDQSLED
jgi:hypothetical protein